MSGQFGFFTINELNGLMVFTTSMAQLDIDIRTHSLFVAIKQLPLNSLQIMKVSLCHPMIWIRAALPNKISSVAPYIIFT